MPSDSSEPQNASCGNAWLTSNSAADDSAKFAASDFLVVQLGPPGQVVRGRLALFIEGAIERALDTSHAPPPGVIVAPDLDASLADQLYRARITGSGGIHLSFSSLAGIANVAGALDAEDSAVLRWWLRASAERPVRLTFSDLDRFLRVYGEPVTLESLLDGAPQSGTHEVSDDFEPTGITRLPPTAAIEEGAALSIAARELAEQFSSDGDDGWLHETLMHLSTPPPAGSDVASEEVAERDDAKPYVTLTDAESTASDDAMPLAHREQSRPISLRLPAIEDFFEDQDDGEDEDDGAGLAEALRESDGSSCVLSSSKAEDIPEDQAGVSPPEDQAGVSPPEDQAGVSPPEDQAGVSPPKQRIAVDVSSSEEPIAADLAEPAREPLPPAPQEHSELIENCRGWCRDLEASNGPKPLSIVERQFVHAYVPLREAVDSGLAPAECREVADQWSQSFARSYSEAFDALRLRGKRPTMVLDVPDIALRLARLHGARSIQLLLVDGMRFDVGIRMYERLRLLAGAHAACVERVLLWAALPSKTSTQIELIGRGATGLREFTGEIDDETLVARGRKAATIRRLRSGRRELYKLDIVEARLPEIGLGGVEPFEDMAFEVAERLASHFEGVPERTLVLVFGDHGFVVEQGNDGALSVRQGGASPEEVLVPAFAWLVGAVH